jgi:RHS repeat-associated protein
VTRADGPLAGSADSVSFAYDSDTGNLRNLTLPVSGTITFGEYDGTGRPGMITDANLNSIIYTYDARGRLTGQIREWDNAETGQTYNLAGKPETISLPNGMTLDYSYDATYGRLIGVSDSLGNEISGAHDDQGNIVQAACYLPTDVQTYLEHFDYQHPDRPGKLWKRINPDGSFFEYGYDAMGNLNRITDPEGRTTGYDYDRRDRMTTAIQPGAIATGIAYDNQNNLTRVTDPGGLVTVFVVDDLGRVVKTVSPDTGTTRHAYDAAGNLVSKTDANHLTTTYTYDNEYRITGIHYPDAAQDVTYTYDAGFLGKGLLTGMTDASGSTIYEWDEAGNPHSEQNTIDGVMNTISYQHDAIGLLTRTTYPDGMIVTWERDAAGNVSRVTATRDGVSRVIADNVAHLPFGPIQSMTLGNGITVNRSFDLLYRMTADADTGIQDLNYDLDRLGNVTLVTDNLDAARDLGFEYDDLYRLTDATGIYGTIEFAMDDVGNRLMRTVDGLTETLSYTDGTNRLDSISGAQTLDIVADSNGNITTYGNWTLSYNQANRLTRVEDGGTVLGTYTYNGIGQRVKKAADGDEVFFHYDYEGHLITEYHSSSGRWLNYIYLDGIPLAMSVAVEGAGMDAPVYFYHTDHLGTPQRMTDESGTVVWAADYLPFGEVDITTDSVENNLRFAGQYYDSETGLHYNYYRYYDPNTGRYLTPDPIGFKGGINLFAYTSNNPINLVDPWGLATYKINRQLGGDRAKHSHNQISHTYVVTTDNNGNVLHSYSWGNRYENNGNPFFNNGEWVQDDTTNDIPAAYDALYKGWATKIDDGDLDPFIQQAYDLLENGSEILQHPWTILYNCKFEANRLIRWANELREKSIKANKCAE